MKKVRVIGVNGIAPWFLSGIVDHQWADLFVWPEKGRPDASIDVVVTNVAHPDILETLVIDFPNASIVHYRPAGFHPVVRGPHMGMMLWNVVIERYNELNEVSYAHAK